MPEKPPSRSLFSRFPLTMFLTLFTALIGLVVVMLIVTFRLTTSSKKIALNKPRAAVVVIPKTSTWFDEEQVSLNYLPTTPLVADVNASYPNKEISYINGDGKLVIYASTGGNPIVNTTDVAGTLTALVTTGELAPSAIHLDSDNYYEILVPGRVGTGTTRQGTLKAFKGNGSAVSGINTSFSQGLPVSAPLVEDLDSDGNPEIILPVYHDINATTSLLGWTWANGQLTGLNSGSPILKTVSGSGAKFSAPSAGNITSTNVSVKEVAAAVENPDGTMSIYVFRKNGTAIQQIPSGGSWYQDNIGATTDNPSVGGIALVDLGGDSRQEIVAATKKTMSSNPMGKYAVRVYSHNSTSGSGQVFAPILETGIVSGIYRASSRPSIGSFQSQSKAIVFHIFGGSGVDNSDGRGLFAAYYNGSSLQWIGGYSPRTITEHDSSCNIKREIGYTTLTLGDGNNNQTNEAFYSKFNPYLLANDYKYLYYFGAEGAPVDDPNCAGAVDHRDVTSFSTQINPGGMTKRIEVASNLELADIDADGLLEMATTYYYPNVNNYNRLYVYDFAGSASSATDWPMAGGNECRQGRYRGSCPPPPSGGPTSTPTRTPTRTPTPVATRTPTPAPTIDPKYACSSNSDCVCAFDTVTNQCATLNKSYPNQKGCVWPDFCAGISGTCTSVCSLGRCTQYCPPRVTVTPSPTPGSGGGALTVTNLLVNPGFETDKDGKAGPDIWTSTSTSKFSRSNLLAHGGSYSGRINIKDNTGVTVGQTVEGLKAGKSYNFSGFVNIPPTTDSFNAYIEIVWRTTGGSNLRIYKIKTYTGKTGGWVNFTATKTAPSNTSKAYVRVRVTNLNANIYLDDFVFK